ncbi:hypothetical protein M2139_002249 [Enterococcus sp. PF1-24]|uniref:DUF5052 family protein n=1 Tax=unclassified Enterococcus TaxID=2608891 RepID=UPI00247307FD|nr:MULTISPECIES: DUF5052 family protein [unclassified Enterococcus]MDH6365247.1 hypothetical protein [Enterococcus sp. PFB1-1]MDH6402348.1 hypothetical protein [Enterococcus sp. PF1-24]
MKKKMQLGLTLLISVVFLSGCQNVRMFFSGFEQSFKGLDMVIQTYDEESQLIDRIEGKSVMIERDETFDTNEESKDSSVIQVTIGSHEMHHVGSSLIIAEKGLENVFEEYSQKVDVTNLDRGIPFVNSMVNDLKNSFTGKKKVILIRSQNGTPLATYAGDKVSLYETDVPKSTGILIDGEYLFVYRCDYTIYDLALLE